MFYESIILSTIYRIYGLFSNIAATCFKGSILYRIIMLFISFFKNSAVFNINRKILLRATNKYWEQSLLFKILDFSMNFLSNYLKRFSKIFQQSLILKSLWILFNRIDILLGLFFLFCFIVPDKKWYNIFNLIAAVFLLLIHFIKNILDENSMFNVRPIDSVFVYFLTAVCIAQVTSISPSLSLRFFVFYMICFLFVILIVSTLNTKNLISTFLEIMLIGVSLSGVYGVWQHITNAIPFDPALTDYTINQGMPGRIISTMGNPNNYAETLVLTLPFFISVILNANSTFNKILYTILMCPPLLALFYTGSRSSWIAFAVSISIFVLFKKRSLFPYMILSGVIILPFLPPYMYRRILTIFNPTDTSLNYRKLIFDTYWPIFKKFWFTGLGLGTDVFMKIVEGFGGGNFIKLLPKTPVHTHNLVTQIWFETGIIGIFTYIWLIFKLIKNSLVSTIEKLDLYINNILLAGASAITGIFVLGLAEYVWYYPRVMLIFWMDIGIIMACLGLVHKKNTILKGAANDSSYPSTDV